MFKLREDQKALKKPAPVARRAPTPEPVKQKPPPKKAPPKIIEDNRPILGYWDIRGLA